MDVYQAQEEVKIFPQKGGWVYVSIPVDFTEQLNHMANRGLITVRATVGTTSWDTSLMPMGDGTHFIPLNAKVRKKEGIELGKELKFSFKLRG
ncbi:MAG: DUF1905 domain-containing protein [Methanolobus sp.]|nr:DUF1905 domain-containing protein [Methanolobus sp.]